MTSIFIWKADKPNTSKQMIRYYSGSNWSLEDVEYSSKSMAFLEQTVIPGLNDSVIIFRSKVMPQDWVGSELLEVTQLPYQKIKEDSYGVLEHIGEWFRFTLTNEIEFTTRSLENELGKIQAWIEAKTEAKAETKTDFTSKNQNRHANNRYKGKFDTTQNKTQKFDVNLNPQKVRLDFQQFLIKYAGPTAISNTNMGQNSQSQNIVHLNSHKNRKNYKRMLM